MANVDKDFRITSTDDLTIELKKDSFTFGDDSTETRVVESILRLVEDSAKEVQDIAVKTLGPLVRKVSEQHVTMIIDHLTTHMADPKHHELREVSISGLKGVLREVDDKIGGKVSALLVPKTEAALKGSSEDVVQECLDVLNDVLVRFGHVAPSLDKVQNSTLPLLANRRTIIRQRSIWVLANVSKYSSDKDFDKLVEALLKELKSLPVSKQSTYIQAIGSLARNVGYRMGKHVGDVLPLLFKAIKESEEEADYDVKDTAFATFESFVSSSPKYVKAHASQIIDLCLEFIKWDPNALEDSDDEDEDSSAASGSGSEESSEEEDDQDEDDDSWKVRRAAAKAITAIIETNAENLSTVIDRVAAPLVKRFTEREQTTRLEVINAFESIVKAAGAASRAQNPEPAAKLKAPLGGALKAAGKLLGGGSVNVRLAAGQFVRTVVAQFPDEVSPALAVLAPGISTLTKDDHQPLRLQGLRLTTDVLNNAATSVKKFLPTLFENIQVAIKDKKASRVVVAALEACSAFINAGAGDIEFISSVYTVLEPRLKSSSLDQDAKAAAIHAAALAISRVGPKLANVDEAIGIIVKRLGAELSRQAAADAITLICESGQDINTKPIVGGLSELTTLATSANRSVVLSGLQAIRAILSCGADVSSSVATLVDDLSPLIDSKDIQVATAAIQVGIELIRTNTKTASGPIQKVMFSKVEALVTSPLLEGVALAVVGDFYTAVAGLGLKGALSASGLSKTLQGYANKVEPHRQVYKNIGHCLAAVIAADKKGASSTIKKLSADAKKQNIVSLYALGEYGRQNDLSSNSVFGDVIVALDADSKDVKDAASAAIGGIAVGNLGFFLPLVIADMKNTEHQYLLLQSIKEIVRGQNSAGESTDLRLSLSASMGGGVAQDVVPHLDTLLPILLENANSTEDATKAAVSECLGRLARLDSARIVPQLAALAASKDAGARATGVSAIYYSMSTKNVTAVDAAISEHVPTFLALIGDADPNVSAAALAATIHLLETKPRMVRAHLEKVINDIFAATVIDKSLIKVIDLGQVKHTTDRGLEKRSNAYALLDVLIDTAFEVVDVKDFIDPLVRGLADIPRLKTSSHNTIMKLCQLAGPQLFPHLGKLVPPLTKEVKTPIPKSTINMERALSLKKSAARAVYALTKIQGAGDHVPLQETVTKYLDKGFMNEHWEEIKREAQ